MTCTLNCTSRKGSTSLFCASFRRTRADQLQLAGPLRKNLEISCSSRHEPGKTGTPSHVQNKFSEIDTRLLSFGASRILQELEKCVGKNLRNADKIVYPNMLVYSVNVAVLSCRS